MLNLAFEKRVVINAALENWVASPSAGVFRKRLAFSEGPTGHVTSIVKYEKGADFSAHKHPLGEEILVLEGVFSDETGDYGAGTYIRNPPGSQHTPFSKEGCTIFVKLNQFSERDDQFVRVDATQSKWLPGIGGLQVMPLHEFEHEHVALVKWPAKEVFQPHRHFGGEEILVLSGEFCDEYGRYPANTWIRSPHQSQHHPFVEQETIIFVKTGHLPLSGY
ncbi:cupin domain-containing protein [Alkalimarinus sediminis]|uniref:Cupin domain-containing protein n=1 Tax=Alkalimarinus sediminis TaxID=1632866 RepID=A0A9E8HJ74_9ALTE|nr:cupin domain-containing protein [Alkalimarinus sediminis]UZW75673.1 cupin domain-containing protein [Alkalimarinus sediminis]